MPRVLRQLGVSSSALAPAAVIVVVATADFLGSSDFVIRGLLVVAPMLAANLVGPRLTAFYGVVAVGVTALLGLPEEDLNATERRAQYAREVGIISASIIAMAVSRRRVRRERQLAQLTRVADVAQRAILAPIPPVVGPVRCVVLYASAASESTVGGDAYAALETPFGARMLVADVRGKGLEAVRLASHVLGAFRERAHEREDLAMLLDDLDAAVRRSGQGEDFVTAVLAQVDDDGRLTLVNAGHPAPLLVRSGAPSCLEPPVDRPPLGLAGATLPRRIQLEPGDRLLLYTDGLTEARRPKDRAFFPLLSVAPETLGVGSLERAVTALSGALDDWVGGHLGDDVALLAVELPAPEPEPEPEPEAAAEPAADETAPDALPEADAVESDQPRAARATEPAQ